MATRHRYTPGVKRARRTTIAQDEPAFMLDVIAEKVVEDVARLLHRNGHAEVLDANGEVPGKTKAIKYLVDHANASYEASAPFAAKIRGPGNTGRHTLFVFMEHWLASWCKKNAPRVFAELPHGYGWSYSPTVEEDKIRRAEFRRAAKRG